MQEPSNKKEVNNHAAITMERTVRTITGVEVKRYS